MSAPFIDVIQEQQGWDDSTFIVLLLAFLDEIDQRENFEAYLQECADEENEECEGSDG
jgi:hypothetical protein